MSAALPSTRCAGRLYVAERLAGPFGEGIIHVYQLDADGSDLSDGFESGGHHRVVERDSPGCGIALASPGFPYREAS